MKEIIKTIVSFTIIAGWLSIPFLAGCSDNYVAVYPGTMEQSYKDCEPHGGSYHTNVRGTTGEGQYYVAVCKDGTQVARRYVSATYNNWRKM